jgi:hypothetical protein
MAKIINVINYDKNKQLAVIALKVKANAKVSEIRELLIINDKYYLKLSIKALPKNGKANEAILDFLSKEWRIAKTNLEIITGHNHSLKLLAVKNITLDYLNSHLNHYIN